VLWHRAARTISFYKNGAELGTPFKHVSEDKLFPMVRGKGRQEKAGGRRQAGGLWGGPAARAAAVAAAGGSGWRAERPRGRPPIAAAHSRRPAAAPAPPQVGMRTREEEVLANFGGQAFRADLQGLQQAYTRGVLAGIQGTRVPFSLSMIAAGVPNQSLEGRLVFEHLVHERHWQAAALVARDVLGGEVEFGPQQVGGRGAAWSLAAPRARAAWPGLAVPCRQGAALACWRWPLPRSPRLTHTHTPAHPPPAACQHSACMRR
jgi:hypothetical protein